MSSVSIDDIESARQRISETDLICQTPLERSRSLGEYFDGTVYLKMEHLQRTGSFKPRGAYNKLSALAKDGGVSGVVAASAGNHAQGVALAADHLGIDSTIVMPESAPQSKIDATSGYGAEVVLHGDDFAAAMNHAQELDASNDTTFIHAFDDPQIVAGQGTIGLELLDELSSIDTVVVPIGGGGLIGGISVAIKARDPSVRIVGVQAAGAATVPDSLKKGGPVATDDPNTIADGIATGNISALTYDLIDRYVDDVVVVTDDQIAESIQLLIERAKQVVEGAGAAAIAPILFTDTFEQGETVVPILGGGNIDTTTLQEVLRHALVERDQFVELAVNIDDMPGKMGDVASIIGNLEANIRSVRHQRYDGDLSISEANLVFEIETTGTTHLHNIMSELRENGYQLRRT